MAINGFAESGGSDCYGKRHPSWFGSAFKEIPLRSFGEIFLFIASEASRRNNNIHSSLEQSKLRVFMLAILAIPVFHLMAESFVFFPRILEDHTRCHQPKLIAGAIALRISADSFP